MITCTSTENPNLNYENRCRPVCDTISASTTCTGSTNADLYPGICHYSCDQPGDFSGSCPTCTLFCESVPSDCYIVVEETQCNWLCDTPLTGFSCEAPACAFVGSSLDTNQLVIVNATQDSCSIMNWLSISLLCVLVVLALFAACALVMRNG
jgi:hypothetical protein